MMNIGDYVRTEYGIEKIKIIEKDFLERENTFIATDNDSWRGAYNGKYYGFTTRNEIIIKSSPNIIDLIEVGDIITTNNLCGEITKIDGDKIYTTCYNGEYCSASDIKSIVTKKQFESMEYKVGE